MPSARPNQPSVRCRGTLRVRARRRLKDKEEDPAGKDDGVNGEDKGRYRRGVQQVVADGVAKTVDHDHGNQQRHAEVEVLAQESRRRGVRCGRATGLVVIGSS